MKNKTCYVVKFGRRPGIYKTWDQVREQTDGFVGASFKKCKNEEEAKGILGIKNVSPSEMKKVEMEQTHFLSNSKSILNLYTDGSFCPENFIYSYSFLLVESGRIVHKESGSCPNKEVGRALNSASGELKAAMKAVLFAAKSGKRCAIVYYDDNRVGNLANGKKIPKNEFEIKYVEFINKITKKYGIKLNFTKVRAHKGNVFNEEADRLAKKELLILRRKLGIYVNLSKGYVEEELMRVRSVGYSYFCKHFEHKEISRMNKSDIKTAVKMIIKETSENINKKNIDMGLEDTTRFVLANLKEYKKWLESNKKKRERKIAMGGNDNIVIRNLVLTEEEKKSEVILNVAYSYYMYQREKGISHKNIKMDELIKKVFERFNEKKIDMRLEDVEKFIIDHLGFFKETYKKTIKKRKRKEKKKLVTKF